MECPALHMKPLRSPSTRKTKTGLSSSGPGVPAASLQASATFMRQLIPFQFLEATGLRAGTFSAAGLDLGWGVALALGSSVGLALGSGADLAFCLAFVASR